VKAVTWVVWGKEHATGEMFTRFLNAPTREKALEKAWFLYGNIGYILTVQKI